MSDENDPMAEQDGETAEAAADAAGGSTDGGASAGRSADDEAFSRLEERLDRASETAERLIAEAARRAMRKPPPAGWQNAEARDGQEPRGADGRPAGSDSLLGTEGDLVLGILGSLRDRIPPDLQQRLADAVREVLLAIRALIDWYLERSDRSHTQPAEVQDIPIL